MGKAPAFQFYVKDWLGDAELQMASSSSRGIWINALCFMWEAKERGKLSGSIDQLAKLLGATNGDFSDFLEDMKLLKFGDVTVRNNLVTLINRRMYKEQKDREITRLRVQRFRCNAKSNANVTVLSSSSSSSSTTIINKKNIYGEFENVRLTDEELQKLQSQFDKNGTKERIENLSRYIASKGKKYSSHYATILSWERKNNPEGVKDGKYTDPLERIRKAKEIDKQSSIRKNTGITDKTPDGS